MQTQIKRLFPLKTVFHRLSDLNQKFSSQVNSDDNICLSFETSNRTRKFCNFAFSELCYLFEQTIESDRSLYEVIPPLKSVKLYIDFEYYLSCNHEIKDHLIGLKCVLKILQSVFNTNNISYTSSEEFINAALQQFLVLTASTPEKVSYHIIHANPSIMFNNNQILGIFIRLTVNYFLCLLIRHKCPYFSMDIPCKNYSFRELIALIGPHVRLIRLHCTNCSIYGNWIYASDVSYLFVFNQENQWTLAIDTHVYSKNQQFRLFKCVKNGQNNPFIETNDFVFEIKRNHSFNNILHGSLITNVQVLNKPLLSFKDNNLLIDAATEVFSFIELQCFISKLNEGNNCSTFRPTTQNNSPSSINQSIQINKSILHSSIDSFTDFVSHLIKHDPNHQGFIRSQLIGTRNPDIAFFNIGGNYRFCPRKGSHHLRNSVCILIDMSNYKFAIRCKDPQCDNSILIWNKIK